MGRPPGGLAGCICTVSGHDFSGAEKQDRVWALAPGRALRQLHRLQWLKPSFFYELSARLKPCPDTIHRLEREKSGLGGVRGVIFRCSRAAVVMVPAYTW